jgi:hypothetical protein
LVLSIIPSGANAQFKKKIDPKLASQLNALKPKLKEKGFDADQREVVIQAMQEIDLSLGEALLHADDRAGLFGTVNPNNKVKLLSLAKSLIELRKSGEISKKTALQMIVDAAASAEFLQGDSVLGDAFTNSNCKVSVSALADAAAIIHGGARTTANSGENHVKIRNESYLAGMAMAAAFLYIPDHISDLADSSIPPSEWTAEIVKRGMRSVCSAVESPEGCTLYSAKIKPACQSMLPMQFSSIKVDESSKGRSVGRVPQDRKEHLKHSDVERDW